MVRSQNKTLSCNLLCCHRHFNYNSWLAQESSTILAARVQTPGKVSQVLFFLCALGFALLITKANRAFLCRYLHLHICNRFVGLLTRPYTQFIYSSQQTTKIDVTHSHTHKRTLVLRNIHSCRHNTPGRNHLAQ